jgi:hypothetical protein
MKYDQIVVLIVLLAFVAVIFKIIAGSFDEIAFDYDPSTGRQSFKARKSLSLVGDSLPVIEGK